MSFVSKIKSPLKIKKLFKHHDNKFDDSFSSIGYDVNSNERNVLIYHIDSDNFQHLSLNVLNNDIGKTLIDRVCNDFNLTDYAEYFGLKYTSNYNRNKQEILWLDPLKAIGKQLKYSTSNVLTLRVKHFPGNADKIDCEQIRYLIYLQLKSYMQKGHLKIPQEIECKLAAYALQSMYGDYDVEFEKTNYIENEKLVSKKALVDNIRLIHKSLAGKSPSEAELLFLKDISNIDVYGAEIVTVKNKKGILVNIGASHKGIIVYLSDQSSQIDVFPWSQIGKINLSSNSIIIYFHRPENINPEEIRKEKMTFWCDNDYSCKHLWKHILDQKAFFTFNRGTDVPTIRSSKRLFHRTAKFRYSGRCESELFIYQQEKNTSPKSSNGTLTITRRPSLRNKKSQSNKNSTQIIAEDNQNKNEKVDDSSDKFNDPIVDTNELQITKEQLVTKISEDTSFKSVKELTTVESAKLLNPLRIDDNEHELKQRNLFKRDKFKENIGKFSKIQEEEFNEKILSFKNKSLGKTNNKNTNNPNEHYVMFLISILFFLVILLFIFKVFNICDLSVYFKKSLNNLASTNVKNSNFIFYRLFSLSSNNKNNNT